MTYHAGIGDGMRAFGLMPCDPHLRCDGCGVERPVIGPRGPFAWFLDNKCAPGWSMDRVDGGRRDWCQRCTRPGVP